VVAIITREASEFPRGSHVPRRTTRPRQRWLRDGSNIVNSDDAIARIQYALDISRSTPYESASAAFVFSILNQITIAACFAHPVALYKEEKVDRGIDWNLPLFFLP
jgi:hypothetical protein